MFNTIFGFLLGMVITFITLAVIGFYNKAEAYMIGNSYANQISCEWTYNSDYGRSGYVGTYRTGNGNLYRIWFGNNYCPY